MAKESGSNATDSTPVNAEISDAQVSPDLESKVQESLDDAFGGVDKDALDKEAPADSQESDRTSTKDADVADEGYTTVRQHRRRVRKRGRSEDDDSGWEESPRDPIHDDDPGEGDETGEAAGEAAGEEPEPTPAEGDQTPDEIPPYLLEAARRRGWTDDRIQRLTQADPELARETFEQLHQDANDLSRRYAEIGRAMQGQPPQQTGQPAPQQPGQPPVQGYQTPAPGSQFQQPQWPQQNGVPGQQPGQQPMAQQGQQQPPQQQGNILLPEFELPKELLENLDEDFKTGFVDKLQNHMQQVNQVINNVVAQHEQYIQERQREMLYQQIDQFFDGRKGYEKLYGSGKERNALTQDELQQRMEVVQQADAIRAGAAFQGRQLTVAEALEMAHNLVTSQHQRETARRDIQGQLRKRERQATVRPTHRSGPQENSKDPLAKATHTASKKLRELNGASR